MKHTLYRLVGLLALLQHHRGRRKRRYKRRGDFGTRLAAALARRLLAR